jgi:hypothetical protein
MDDRVERLIAMLLPLFLLAALNGGTICDSQPPPLFEVAHPDAKESVVAGTSLRVVIDVPVTDISDAISVA